MIKVDFPALEILDLIIEMLLQWFLTKLQELRMKEISINTVDDSFATFTFDSEIKWR